MPAKAGIQNYLKILDSRFHGNDVKGYIKTFYDTIKVKAGRSFNYLQQYWDPNNGPLMIPVTAILRTRVLSTFIYIL